MNQYASSHVQIFDLALHTHTFYHCFLLGRNLGPWEIKNMMKWLI